MKLETPLLPDEDYLALLQGLDDRLDSVHFALPNLGVFDARQHELPGEASQFEALASVPKADAFLLLNGRMLPPSRYLDKVAMLSLATFLRQLVDDINLRGIVLADLHLLNALSKTAPEACAELEAVPSVNCMIDSPKRANAVLNTFAETPFRPPSRVVLDRSLNRDRDARARTSAVIRKRLPESKVVLLANEGCLPNCPYKGAHDAHIAMVNLGFCTERTHEANREFACLREFHAHPERLLASPYIRPEDMKAYAEFADVIKICGRTKGGDFLFQAVSAYRDRYWHGNLLDLLDAAGDASHLFHLNNDALPEGFLSIMERCSMDCASCRACEPMLKAAFRRKVPTL